MATVHLHQVRPLQGNAQVQAAQKQSDQTNARVPDIYAQWHGGVSVTSEKQKNLIRESFMTDFSYICTRNNCCGESQTVFISWETEATRFCLEGVKPEISNSVQDGVRRFTHMRGLVVSS
jgi:hypothetical protein